MLSVLRSLPERYGRPAVSGSYLRPIDGLRALAIAIVIVWHIAIRVFRLTLAGPIVTSDDAGFLHVVPHGEIGVSLFFFISGFIIVRPFVTDPAGLGWARTGQFYLRRLIRIAPPHLILVTLAFLALAVVGYRPERAVNFDAAPQSLLASYLASLVYLNGLIFHTPPRLNPPTWSLEIEMQFYVLFPVLLALYARLWRRAGVWLPAVLPPLAFALVTSAVFALLGGYSPLRWTVLTYLYLFLLGITVARLELLAPAGPAIPRATCDMLFLLGLVLLLGTGLFRDRQSVADETFRILATMAATMLLYYGATRGGLATRLLSGRWIALAGAMSYSIYLTHVAVIQFVATILFRIADLHGTIANMALATAVLLPAVMVAGTTYYIFVERFFMGFGKHARQPKPNTTAEG